MFSRFALVGVVAAVGITLAACSSQPGPTAGPSTGPSVAPTAVPSARPSIAPSNAPSTAPPSTVPSASPAPTLTPAEAVLAEFLRVDARLACAPRRADLPPGAVLGIECHPADSLVEAVGVYTFATDGSIAEPARTAYLQRMATAKVTPGSGDCEAGTPGDHAWPSNLPDEGEDGGLASTRAGCFLDENGTANIRLTCYGEVYVGVLGRTKELARLNAWTWKVADGESVHRDPPGICAAPD
jgi:hypothetical protein